MADAKRCTIADSQCLIPYNVGWVCGGWNADDTDLVGWPQILDGTQMTLIRQMHTNFNRYADYADSIRCVRIRKRIKTNPGKLPPSPKGG
ncbi:MAG: hypothetical protein JWR61_5243 [Ferruginibacter sp.]|nr:hypothetical protein [Ferruginibacter sp.]